ncbi:major facilitator superfamily domain-containing protein [Suillus ampliporus]|nr:major facilitator superfamily domain-containing protein [Suillus ampliporus]
MSPPNDKKTVDGTDATTGAPCRSRDVLEKRLRRKLDLRTMPMIVVMATMGSVSLLFGSAVHSIARLAGYEADLHLKGNQYGAILSIIYVGYIFMQLPSPAVFIPSCMVVWGGVSVLTGFYTMALVSRLFLDFVEGPFIPGAVFFLSGWYKRDELALRLSIFFNGNVLSSAVLPNMQGVLGQAAWGRETFASICRWLFYITGSITILVGVCAVFILPDFPHNTRWLTPEERALAVSRLEVDAGLEERTIMGGLWDAVSDCKVWWLSTAFIIQTIGQSLLLFPPTLVATLGYDLTNTLLLSLPPWVFATTFSLVFSRYSDKMQRRYIYYFASNVITVIGVIVSMCTMNKTARYISMFLMAQCLAAPTVLWGWVNNTFAREPAKRAVAIALINGLSQTGNIIGSFVWPSNWGPTYRYSYGICLATFGVSTAMFGVMHLHLKHLNKRIKKNEQDTKDVDELGYPIGFRYLV